MKKKKVTELPDNQHLELLFLGKKYSIKGLIREVKRCASSQCKGKDIAANVRARMYWLKKNMNKLRYILDNHKP